MWYKVAISREDASRVIQQELSSGQYDSQANSESDLIKKQLMDKYGEEYKLAIDEEIGKLRREFSASRPWESGSDETTQHGKTTGINAFYILPDGTLTPNLSSHVSFDKILLHRLGINPSALTDRSDRHVLSDLVGAVRVNIAGDSKNATIYYPLTSEQKARLEDLDINTFDYRNDLTSETPATNENDELLESLENLGKQLSSIGSSLEDILRKYISSKMNPKFSSETSRTEPYMIKENVQNIDDKLFQKLSEIEDNFSSLENISDSLRDIRS